jgi:hypothetical protein
LSKVAADVNGSITNRVLSKQIEVKVHLHWESVKKGEIDGLVMERVVTRRPKKAIKHDGRTFDVHYTYKRVGKMAGKKGSSGIFRSLPEVCAFGFVPRRLLRSPLLTPLLTAHGLCPRPLGGACPRYPIG